MLHLKKLYIFDWDGTLLNSSRNVISAHEKTMRHFDIINITRTEIESMLGMERNTVCQWITRFSIIDAETYYRKFRTFYEAGQAQCQLFPGTEAVLMILQKQDRRIAIATNKAENFAKPEIEMCAVSKFFDTMAFADQSRAKPDPSMLNIIMRKMEVRPEDTVMIGDQIADVESAYNAGVESYTLINEYDNNWKIWPESVLNKTTILDMDGLLLGLCPKKEHLHQ